MSPVAKDIDSYLAPLPEVQQAVKKAPALDRHHPFEAPAQT
jgi:hypothetical protein